MQDKDTVSEPPAPDASRPSPSFVRLVRHALGHLYDPVDLLKHPLAVYLADSLPNIGNRAQELRIFLIDAIDGLEAPERAMLSEKERRPHLVLVDRYIGGLSFDEIAAKLHLGSRQVRREHEEGVLALASYLWMLCGGAASGKEQAGKSSGDSLRTEVDALGIKVENLILADLIAATESAARALAKGYDVRLSVGPAAVDLRALYDSTLAKQALLSCLNTLCAQRPKHLEIAATTGHDMSCLEIRAVPPVSLLDEANFAQGLDECNALMAAQGSSATMIRSNTDGDSSLCAGIRLRFRRQQNTHVLVIDDNQKTLQLYSRYLASGQHSVSFAISAAEAEALLAKSTPDIIILDVMMRDMDGWELLERLRSRPELLRVPIVICSALKEPKLAQLLGAQAYVTKPVVVDELLGIVNRLLAKNSQEEPSLAGL